MKNLRSRLEAELAEKKILIMAHRGVCGANIIENTMEAFELALRQGRIFWRWTFSGRRTGSFSFSTMEQKAICWEKTAA